MKSIRRVLLIVFVYLWQGTLVNAMEVKERRSPIQIDGQMTEQAWQDANWHYIDQPIIGKLPSASDFSGRFKLLWDENYLYLLAEIQDDVLFDSHPDPLQAYWDDDCLEVFIDEDASGGDHQFNFNAFAYHIALDNQVVDIGPSIAKGKTNFILLNEHIDSRWQRNQKVPHQITWELEIKIFDETFNLVDLEAGEKTAETARVELKTGKKMGFMLAYCDNDGSPSRESFIGSTAIEPVNGDKNRGYIDASVFQLIHLRKAD